MPREERTRRATIHDVARHAGVSAATVSKVLRGVVTVRKENADRVHDAVAELGYRLDPLASSLRNENRRIIGAVVPDLESPFFGALVTGLEDAAEKAGYYMIVASSRESEDREAQLVARMGDWRVSGTVLMPVTSERGKGAQVLREQGMQAVLVDRVSADDRFDTVSADNYEASAKVADFLLGLGHRHILLHGAVQTSEAIRRRLAGFTERARSLDPSVRVDTLLANGDMDAERGAIRDYFDARAPAERPTAVFTLSQPSTLLVVGELRRLGIQVPDDVAFVGFDDADWMQTTWPSITAIAQPVTTLAEHAMATLLARIEGEKEGAPVQRLEPCEMLVRQSAGPGTAPRHYGRGE